VSGGQYVTCGLGQAGTAFEAFCWGFGGDGESGDSTVGSHATAYPVAGGLNFASISAGVFHTCGLTTENLAYCWGDNGGGQTMPPGELGDGTTIQRHVPTLVAGGLRFQSISAGLGTCGLTTTGVAYCWGDNDDGAVGDGGTTDRLVPTAVATGAYTFVQLWTSRTQSCGLTAAGAAYCWGGAGLGEVGDGTITTRLVPTAVSGGLTFTSLVGGMYYTCGLVAGGQAYCWGNNNNGAIGDGTTTMRLVPTLVAGGISFTSLTAGEHTCGLTSAGAAYCWGPNQYGELGDGTTTQRLVPTAVASGIVFASIAAGVDHTCGRTSANVLYCWGRNDHAQLGVTTAAPFTNQTVPTLVIP
jgi:alpha-tubulin suppressor-like RCC1 family protein